MLSKNYIQFNYDGNLLKFYIDRSDYDEIQNCVSNGDDDVDVEISELVGCLTNKHNINIYDIHGEDFENVLLFFNNRLYRVDNLYIDYSSELDRKPKDVIELILFKNDVQCLVTINCTLSQPIYPI